jgi:sRNA-binding regulator protein Hfq
MATACVKLIETDDELKLRINEKPPVKIAIKEEDGKYTVKESNEEGITFEKGSMYAQVPENRQTMMAATLEANDVRTNGPIEAYDAYDSDDSDESVTVKPVTVTSPVEPVEPVTSPVEPVTVTAEKNAAGAGPSKEEIETEITRLNGLVGASQDQMDYFQGLLQKETDDKNKQVYNDAISTAEKERNAHNSEIAKQEELLKNLSTDGGNKKHRKTAKRGRKSTRKGRKSSKKGGKSHKKGRKGKGSRRSKK